MEFAFLSFYGKVYKKSEKVIIPDGAHISHWTFSINRVSQQIHTIQKIEIVTSATRLISKGLMVSTVKLSDAAYHLLIHPGHDQIYCSDQIVSTILDLILTMCDLLRTENYSGCY